MLAPSRPWISPHYRKVWTGLIELRWLHLFPQRLLLALKSNIKTGTRWNSLSSISPVQSIILENLHFTHVQFTFIFALLSLLSTSPDYLTQMASCKEKKNYTVPLRYTLLFISTVLWFEKQNQRVTILSKPVFFLFLMHCFWVCCLLVFNILCYLTTF